MIKKDLTINTQETEITNEKFRFKMFGLSKEQCLQNLTEEF